MLGIYFSAWGVSFFEGKKNFWPQEGSVTLRGERGTERDQKKNHFFFISRVLVQWMHCTTARAVHVSPVRHHWSWWTSWVKSFSVRFLLNFQGVHMFPWPGTQLYVRYWDELVIDEIRNNISVIYHNSSFFPVVVKYNSYSFDGLREVFDEI